MSEKGSIRERSYIDRTNLNESSMFSLFHKDQEEVKENGRQREFWWNSMQGEEKQEEFKQTLDMLIANRVDSIQGHLGSVLCVALNVRDNMMITGGFDSMIRVWDLERDTCIKVIREHKGCVNAVIYFPERNIFVSASSDSQIIVWSLNTLTAIYKTDSEHVNGVSKLCVSNDYSRVWSSGFDGEVKLWILGDSALFFEGPVYSNNKTSSREINSMVLSTSEEFLCLGTQDGSIKMVNSMGQGLYAILSGHKMAVQCLALSRDDSILYSGGSDNSIRIWKITSRPAECIKVIQDLESGVMNLHLTMDSQSLITTCMKDVIVWDTRTWRIKKQFPAHNSEIYTLFVYPNVSVFVTGSMDKSLKFWSIEDNYMNIKTIEGHSDAVRCLFLSPDEKVLFTGGYDNTVKIWNLVNKLCLATLEGHEGCVTDLTYVEVSEVLFSASKDGTVKAWSMSTKKCIRTYAEAERFSVYSIALFKTSQVIACAHKHPDIRLWDVNSQGLKGILKGHSAPVTVVKASHNEKFLCSAGEDTEIIIWDIKSTKMLKRFGKDAHSKPISSMAISPDSKLLITGGEDKTIKVWSLDEFGLMHTFTDHKDIITSLIFSSRSLILYSTSLDGFFRIWDMATLKSITSIGTSTVGLNDMVLNKSEGKIYLAASDASVKIFEINEAITESKLEGHEGKIYDLEIVDGPNGNVIITSSEDKTIRVWDPDTLACRKVVSTKQVIYCHQIGSNSRLYCGAEDSRLRTYDSLLTDGNTKNPQNNFFNGQHDDVITCITMSHDEELLFTGSAKNDQTIRVWGIKQQSMLYELPNVGGSVTKLRVNHSKTKLYVATNNSLIKVFDLDMRREESSLKGHRGSVNDIVLSFNETYLYSGGADHTIKVWNLHDESVMETYKEHTDEVLCLLYAQTGQHLFSSGKDRYIHIYLTIDGQCIYKMKTSDENIGCMQLCMSTHTLFGGGDHYLNAFNFYTYSSIYELDAVSLESLKHYIQADTNTEKSKELVNFVEGLKLKNNLYYTHRVNPIMFLANLPFPTILRYALNTFKYPKFSFSYEDDLLYRTLVDEDKRNNHLNTVCDYLIDNPKEIYLHQKTIEEMMKMYNNSKIQKLLTVLFNSAIKGQEGSHLINKGKLRSNPIMKQTTYIDTIPKSLNMTMIKDEKRLEEIDYRITKFPLNMHNGTSFSLLFFKGLGKCQKDVILSDMKHVINYKWFLLKKFIIIHAICYWIFAVSMIVHLIWYNYSYILLAICIIFGSLLVIYEIISAVGNWTKYLSEDFNWLDLLVILIGFASLYVMWADFSIETTGLVTAFAVLLLMLRALTYFRIFDSMRYLISLTLQVGFDMIPFLIVSFVFVMTFAFMALVLHRMELEEGKEDPEIPERHLFMPNFLQISLIFINSANTKSYSTADWVLFYVSSVILAVAFLTLLVAIASNSLYEIRSNHTYFDLMEKLSIISDFDNFLHNLGFKKYRENWFSHQIIAFYPEVEDDAKTAHLIKMNKLADAVSTKIDILEFGVESALDKIMTRIKTGKALQIETEDDDLNATSALTIPTDPSHKQSAGISLGAPGTLENLKRDTAPRLEEESPDNLENLRGQQSERFRRIKEARMKMNTDSAIQGIGAQQVNELTNSAIRDESAQLEDHRNTKREALGRKLEVVEQGDGSLDAMYYKDMFRLSDFSN